jgi:hydrogenase/urease accessory protein HupE
MFRVSKLALATCLILLTVGPAVAHPGHGPDNSILHGLVHWTSNMDPALGALGAGVLALASAVAVALVGRRRRANQR